MTHAPENLQLWNYLLQLAETLEETPNASINETLLAQLQTVQEAFGDTADPVDHYEAYVTLKLCRAIAHALQQTD